jgi:hypothetical protein
MLTPILATDDPYRAAVDFQAAGWSLIFSTPPAWGDPLACVGLAGAQVMLGTSLPRFLPAESRPHRGAGVEFHVTVPAADIDAIFGAHKVHAAAVTDLVKQPWGERAFHAVLAGYRFLIAAGEDAGSQSAAQVSRPCRDTFAWRRAGA